MFSHAQMTTLQLVALLFTFCGIPLAYGEGALSFPHIERGACIGEACSLGIELIAMQDTEARATYSASAKVTYQVHKNERLYASDGLVITTKPGVLNVRQRCQLDESITVSPGDKVLILRYVGEGFERAWYKGRYFDIECLGWCGPKGCLEETGQEAEYKWWLLVENASGKRGWVRSEPFIHQNRYAQYEPEADWLVLRKGDTKLGFTFTEDNRLLHKGNALSRSFMPGTHTLLVSAWPPQLLITCYRTEINVHPQTNIPRINEGCSLLTASNGNCDAAGCKRVADYWPGRRTAPYIGTDYALLYLDPSTGDRDGLLTDGGLILVDLKSGVSKRVPIQLAGPNERQLIDIESLVRKDVGFLVNVYVGCDTSQPACDGRYSRSYRLHLDPLTRKVSTKDIGNLAATGMGTKSGSEQEQELAKLAKRLDALKQLLPEPPKYLYYDVGSAGSIIATIALDWSDRLNKTLGIEGMRSMYEEFYLASSQFRSMAIMALGLAERAIQTKSPRAATRYMDSAEKYLRQFQQSDKGAYAIYIGDIDIAKVYAQTVKDLSEFFVKLGVDVMVGPTASVVISSMYIGLDYIVDSNDSELHLEEVERSALLNSIQLIAFSVVKYPSLNGKTISSAISDRVTLPIGHAISKSPQLLKEFVASPEFRSRLAKTAAHLSKEGIGRLVDKSFAEWSRGVETLSQQPSL